jgi:hypothetical protein
MKTFFTPNDTREILERIDKLTPQTQRHCSILLRIARGLDKPKRRLLGILLGWAVKRDYFGEKPYPKNSYTDPTFKIVDKKIFEEEKQKLIDHITAFSTAGAAGCTTHPNPFFGNLTPDEWAQGQYKHIDHHLKQFGV